jgi:predicted phage terminase large subunit-like protein
MIHELTPREYAYLLRNDLRFFIERSFYALNPGTRFEANWHIDVIAAKLEDCLRGKIRRLIVNLPPRSLKSHAITVAFPAWALGLNPSLQIICASYGMDLSEKHARDSRNLMMNEFYKDCFPTRLAPHRLMVTDFETTAKGSRLSVSVGGPITGRGGNLIIVDDPLKPEEALSEVSRKKANEWFDGTLSSRLNQKEEGVYIIVMQRLHQDDLVGHLLERGDSWEVLNFPAIAEEEECHVIETIFGTRTFTRKAGEALHPKRESLESLRRTRELVGEYTFLSQYQQAPVPKGGAMIKTEWLTYYAPGQRPDSFIYILQSWDTANKSGELNDYSVCTTWGVAGGKYYLLDVFRRRLDYPDLKRAVWEQARKYRHPKVLIEDKGSGTQLIQELKREGLLYIHGYEPPTGADKVMRLFAQSHHFESGKVMLPATASWLDEYRRELTAFPGSKHDDQVDSTTQALHYMATNTSLEVWARIGRGF